MSLAHDAWDDPQREPASALESLSPPPAAHAERAEPDARVWAVAVTADDLRSLLLMDESGSEQRDSAGARISSEACVSSRSDDAPASVVQRAWAESTVPAWLACLVARLLHNCTAPAEPSVCSGRRSVGGSFCCRCSSGVRVAARATPRVQRGYFSVL